MRVSVTFDLNTLAHLARYSDREITEELLHNDARLQKRVKWFFKNNRKQIKQYVQQQGGTSKQENQLLEDGMVTLFHDLKINGRPTSSLSAHFMGICKSIWEKNLAGEKLPYPHLHEEKAMEKLFARIEDADVQVLKAFYFEAKPQDQISRQFGKPHEEIENEKKWSALKQLKDFLIKDEELLNELISNLPHR